MGMAEAVAIQNIVSLLESTQARFERIEARLSKLEEVQSASNATNN